MQIKLEANLSKSTAALMVVGIYLNEAPDKVVKELFGAGEVYARLALGASEVAKYEGFKGKLGQVLSIPTFDKVSFKRLVLFGLGGEEEARRPDFAGYRKLGVAVARRMQAALRADETTEKVTAGKTTGKSKAQSAGQTQAAGKKAGSVSACVCVRVKKGKDQKGDLAVAAHASVIEALILSSFSYEKYKSMKEAGKQAKLEAQATLSHFSLAFAGIDKRSFDLAAARGRATGMAVNMARGLIAEPASYMTPSRLALEARRIAKDHNLTVKVLDEVQIAKLGMGSFLGVARGAREQPRLIVLKYTAPKSKKLVALVGKGVTFDSGGLSLKTAAGMEHMKYDMAGAAAVLASMQVLGELKPAVSVLAVIPATENMPGSNALHPGDVLIAMNGKTIEVNNTDAEGRLILADALTYAVKEGADELIDIATLTGAVVSALGRVAAGIMGSNQKLVEGVIAAGVGSGEKYWQLPLFDEYKEALKSDIADLKNAGSRGEAGSSCAAMFLKEFTEGKPWAHLDIAGVGWRESERDELCKGGTAFGVRTLSNYVLNQKP
jgi:leucyl aminopeptidase